MPEASLKELSEAAPQGPWALSPQDYDDWGTIRAPVDPTTGFRPIVCTIRSWDDSSEQDAARREGRQPKSVAARADFIIGLERAYRAGRLHDDAALAQARRDALEEAARELDYRARRMRIAGIPCGHNAALADSAQFLATAIRALIDTPPTAVRQDSLPTDGDRTEGGR